MIPRNELEVISRGRWLDVFAELAPVLSDAIARPKKHVQCPFPERHSMSGGKRKFRISNPETGSAICTCGSYSGIDLLIEVNGWSFKETLHKINHQLGDPFFVETTSKALSPAEIELARRKSAEKRADLARQSDIRRRAFEKEQLKRDQQYLYNLKVVWEESVSATAPEAKPLWRYLYSRGIDARVLNSVTTSVRFHPSLPFYAEDNSKTFHPAMVCMFSDTSGKAVTFHRTFLSSDGQKANLPDHSDCKLLMPYPSDRKFDGGAIRMSDVGECLSVTEGIETAFAVMESTGLPVWPTYSAYALQNLCLDSIVKLGVKRLLIWADKDRSETGQTVSQKLFERAKKAGLDVQLFIPEGEIPDGSKSIDFADVLASGEQFPAVF